VLPRGFVVELGFVSTVYSSSRDGDLEGVALAVGGSSFGFGGGVGRGALFKLGDGLFPLRKALARFLALLKLEEFGSLPTLFRDFDSSRFVRVLENI